MPVPSVLKHHSVVSLLVLIGLLLVALHWSLPHVREVTRQQLDTHTEAKPEPVILPVIEPSVPPEKKQQYLFTLTLDYQPYQPAVFYVTEDDCLSGIRVNGKTISSLVAKPICSYDIGRRFNLAPYLEPGVNTVQFVLDDNGGIYEFNAVIEAFGHALPASLITLALLASVLALFCLLLSKAGCGRPELFMFCLAGLMYGWMFHSMSYLEYSFDVAGYDHNRTGHLNFIKYIAQRWSLPHPYSGWEYHQPPLYYFIGALFLKASVYFGSVMPATAVRMFSLLCMLSFVAMGILTLSRLLPGRRLVYFAAVALMIYWPQNLNMAGRINNDQLFYALAAAAFYQTVLWHQTLERKRLMWALLIASLAFLTKMMAIGLFITLGLLALWRLYRKELSLSYFFSRPVLAGGVVAVLSIASVLGTHAYYFFTEHRHTFIISEKIHFIDTRVLVENGLVNYLYFDLPTYFSAPFLNQFEDETGRQFLLNVLLKTALFGEFDWKYPGLAQTISGLLLVLIAYAGYALFRARGRGIHLPSVLFIGVSLALLLVFRYNNPCACNEDFRYVYPLLLPCIGLFALGVQALGRRETIHYYWIGLLSAFTFAALSAVFYLIQRPLP